MSFPFVLGVDTLAGGAAVEAEEEEAPAASTGGGWWGLSAMIHATRSESEAARRTPPSACPFCGEPLRTGPDGGLFCLFDGWQPR